MLYKVKFRQLVPNVLSCVLNAIQLQTVLNVFEVTKTMVM